MFEDNYTTDSWAKLEIAKNKSNEEALTQAIDQLVYMPDTRAKVDALSTTMEGYFQGNDNRKGQNDTLIRAITLDINVETRDVYISVYDPEISLAASVGGTGMKTAFTDPPIMGMIAQSFPRHLEIIDDGDVFNAGLIIANAMTKKFGIDINATIAKVLALDESVRTMEFLFDCVDGNREAIPTPKPEYSAFYTLHFNPAPVYLTNFKTDDKARKFDTLLVGETKQLAVIKDDPQSELVWVSKDENVVTVDGSGNITGVKEGEAEVWISVKDSLALPARILIKVSAATPKVADEEIIEESNSEETGDTETLVPPTEEPTE